MDDFEEFFEAWEMILGEIPDDPFFEASFASLLGEAQE
jgi:hypothetical protein